MPPGEVVLVLAVSLAAQAPPSAPWDPAQYVARDTHEGVTLAAKPYLAPAELTWLGPHPILAGGIVPVEVLIVNERAESIRVAWDRAVLLGEEEKFEQIEPERIAWRIYPPPKPTSSRPWPEQRRKLPSDKKRTERETLEAALRSHSMRTAVIPPGGRARGFLYFDRGERPLELAAARLYVPEVVRLPDEEPLLFFEVDLKAYAGPRDR